MEMGVGAVTGGSEGNDLAVPPIVTGHRIVEVLPFFIDFLSGREVVVKLTALRKSIGTSVRFCQPFWKALFEARFVGTSVHDLLRKAELSTDGPEWFLAYKVVVSDVLHDKKWFDSASKKELSYHEVNITGPDLVPSILAVAGLSHGRLIAVSREPYRVIAINLQDGAVQYGPELNIDPGQRHYRYHRYRPIRAIDNSHVLITVSAAGPQEEETLMPKPCLALFSTQSLTLAACYTLPDELVLLEVTKMQEYCMTARHVLGLVEARHPKRYSGVLVTSLAELDKLEGEARDNALLDLGLYLCCWDRRTGQHVSMLKVAERCHHGFGQPYYSPSLFSCKGEVRMTISNPTQLLVPKRNQPPQRAFNDLVLTIDPIDMKVLCEERCDFLESRRVCADGKYIVSGWDKAGPSVHDDVLYDSAKESEIVLERPQPRGHWDEYDEEQEYDEYGEEDEEGNNTAHELSLLAVDSLGAAQTSKINSFGHDSTLKISSWHSAWLLEKGFALPPFFWRQVLLGTWLIPAISTFDLLVLAFLKDIRVSVSADGQHFGIDFEFSESDFLSGACCITKEYQVVVDGNGTVTLRALPCPPFPWKNNNLGPPLYRDEEITTQDGEYHVVPVPCMSIFWWFRDPEEPLPSVRPHGLPDDVWQGALGRFPELSVNPFLCTAESDLYIASFVSYDLLVHSVDYYLGKGVGAPPPPPAAAATIAAQLVGPRSGEDEDGQAKGQGARFEYVCTVDASHGDGEMDTCGDSAGVPGWLVVKMYNSYKEEALGGDEEQGWLDVYSFKSRDVSKMYPEYDDCYDEDYGGSYPDSIQLMSGASAIHVFASHGMIAATFSCSSKGDEGEGANEDDVALVRVWDLTAGSVPAVRAILAQSAAEKEG